MALEEFESMTKGELIKLLRDYTERFRIIKGILYYEYGTVSNDDLLGFIDKAVPENIVPKKID